MLARTRDRGGRGDPLVLGALILHPSSSPRRRRHRGRDAPPHLPARALYASSSPSASRSSSARARARSGRPTCAHPAARPLGSTPLLGMIYPNYASSSCGRRPCCLWRSGSSSRGRARGPRAAAVQDAEMLDGLGVNVPRLFTLTFAGSAALAALAGLLLAPVFTCTPDGVEMILLAFIVVILGAWARWVAPSWPRSASAPQKPLSLWMNPQRVGDRHLRDHDRGADIRRAASSAARDP